LSIYLFKLLLQTFMTTRYTECCLCLIFMLESACAKSS